MTIDWWTLGLQTVNVLILIWLLQRFLYRPIIAVIDRRKADAASALDAADAARRTAEAERSALSAERAALAAERDHRLEDARQAAAAERERLLDIATREAADKRARFETTLTEARMDAEARLKAEAGTLAVSMARRLLERLGPPPADPFLTRLGDRLDATTPADRAAWLGSTGGAVELVVAAPPAPAALSQFQARLTAFAGHDIPCPVTVDPTLLGGAELHLPHAVIRDHWAADLEQLAREVTL